MKSMKRVLVFIALIALVMSLLSVTCFADAETPEASGTTAETPADSGSTTEASGDSETKAPDTTAGDSKNETKPGDSILWTIIPLGVVLVAVAVCAVIFFGIPKRREKTLKFLRSLKSEWKKISWYSWKQTWKGTAVVIVISLVIAILIGILDYVLTRGISALTDLLK